MLREEFLKPLGISINGLALELHVPVTRIGQIVNERRGITVDTALRLARRLGASAEGAWEEISLFFSGCHPLKLGTCRVLQFGRRNGPPKEFDA